MKVYMFVIPHFCSSDTMYVLAKSKKQAIEIVMGKTKHDYDFVNNCFEKAYRSPQIVLTVNDMQY